MITTEALCVDAACSGNPWMMEYRGVHITSGRQIFHFGPVWGTNNIGEFLAIVHGLALLKKLGKTIKIYSDSNTAQTWVRKKQCKTTIERTEKTAELLQIVARAENWLRTNPGPYDIEKWNTEEWGEIPADFGRK